MSFFLEAHIMLQKSETEKALRPGAIRRGIEGAGFGAGRYQMTLSHKSVSGAGICAGHWISVGTEPVPGCKRSGRRTAPASWPGLRRGSAPQRSCLAALPCPAAALRPTSKAFRGNLSGERLLPTLPAMLPQQGAEHAKRWKQGQAPLQRE